MSPEEMNYRFWLPCLKYALVTLVAIIVTFQAGCQAEKYQMRLIVAEGYSPMESACALTALNGTNGGPEGPLCAQAMQLQNAKQQGLLDNARALAERHIRGF